MTIRVLWCAAAALLLTACGEKAVTMEEFRSTEILLPGGQKVLAETMRTELDMTRGMMFRDSLANDRGMLFIHGSPGKFPYWMYQVKIPLDIAWMDSNRQIVEISANTPPCPSKSAKECPNFGGHEKSLYVLELNGGAAAKYGLKVGDRLRF